MYRSLPKHMNEKKNERKANLSTVNKSKYSLLQGNLKRRIRLLRIDSNSHLYIENEIQSLPTALFDTVINNFFFLFQVYPVLKTSRKALRLLAV